MVLTTLLGILSSVAAEVITALNKKLKGTVLEGDAAFLLVFGISFIGAAIKEVITPGFTWPKLLDLNALGSTFAEIFAVSQVYFMFVMKKLHLDVGSPELPPPAASKEPLRFTGDAG